MEGVPMDYPIAVIEKAKRMEQLLQRVAAGESLTDVCADLGVSVDEKRFAALQAKYEAGDRTWKALLDGRFGHERKAHSALRAWLYERKEQDETLRAPQLARETEEKFGVRLSEGHTNYLLRKRGLTAPPGRPYKKLPPVETTPETAPEPTESLGQAGTFFPRSSEARDGSQRDH
jgi:transposase